MILRLKVLLLGSFLHQFRILCKEAAAYILAQCYLNL